MTIPRKRAQTLLLLFGSIIITAVCIVSVPFTPYITKFAVAIWIMRIILIFGALFFGMGIIYFIYELIKNHNMIETTTDGFIDLSSLQGFGFIAYKDIQSIHIQGQFLIVTLKNPEDYLRRVNFIKRSLSIVNKLCGFGLVVINLPTFKTEENCKKFIEILQSNIDIQE